MNSWLNCRYRPSNATQILFEEVDAEVYCYADANTFFALGYSGKSNKPRFHYRFKTELDRQTYIDKWVKRLQQNKAVKLAERKARLEKKKAFKHTLKEGDVLYTSWGYDQTNVDFYQVTKVLSDKSVKVRKIKSLVKETGFMSGEAQPIKDDFIGEASSKQVLPNNVIKFGTEYAFLLTKESVTCSWYG